MTKRSNDVQYILLLTINYDFIGRIGLEKISSYFVGMCSFYLSHDMKFLQIPSTHNLGQGKSDNC